MGKRLVGLVILVGLALGFADQAEAGWYNPSWGYRRAITLSPVTPEANYQVKVTLASVVLTGAQLTSGNANGNDIRFTGSDGTTLQDYWIESWSATGTTVTATIWVEVATSGSSTIYMYYGNPSATSASNGANTFEFFDDFSGDLSKYSTSGGTWAIESGELSGTALDRQLMWVTNLNLTNFEVRMKINFKSDYSVGQGGDALRFTPPSSHYSNYSYPNGDNILLLEWPENVTLDTYTWTGLAYDTNYILKTRIFGSSIEGFLDDVATLSVTNTDKTSGSVGFHINNAHIHFDDIRVRKYASPEPTATAGSEEPVSNLKIEGLRFEKIRFE